MKQQNTVIKTVTSKYFLYQNNHNQMAVLINPVKMFFFRYFFSKEKVTLKHIPF